MIDGSKLVNWDGLVYYDGKIKQYIENKDIGDLEYAGEYYHVSNNVLYGDIDGNGVVDQDDSSYLAQHVGEWIGYEEIPNPIAADLNGDDQIGQEDSFILARHVNGVVGYETLPILKNTLALPSPSVDCFNHIFKLINDTITDDKFFNENKVINKGSLLICSLRNGEYKYDIFMEQVTPEQVTNITNNITEITNNITQIENQVVETNEKILNLTEDVTYLSAKLSDGIGQINYGEF